MDRPTVTVVNTCLWATVFARSWMGGEGIVGAGGRGSQHPLLSAFYFSGHPLRTDTLWAFFTKTLFVTLPTIHLLSLFAMSCLSRVALSLD